MKFISSLVFTFSLFFGFSYAQAQDNPSSSNLSRYIEEIVVTARARDESVRDIPVAITAISEEEMDTYGFQTLDDIANSSASLEINRLSSGSGVQIAIRGIASSPGSLGIEQSK